MKTHISLLRGINVSGQKKVKMEELKKLYESLGFKDVQAYIQSGNVVFRSSEAGSILAGRIEKKVREYFRFEVFVLIRTKDDLQKLIKKNPFSKKDIDKLYVTFLSGYPAMPPLEELNKAKAAEEFFISGREIYLFCPDGYGKTKLSNNFFERKLKLHATTRNWKIVNKLLELSK